MIKNCAIDDCQKRIYLAAIDKMRAGNERLGKWMATALDDESVCAEMKLDIEAWFASWQEMPNETTRCDQRDVRRSTFPRELLKSE